MINIIQEQKYFNLAYRYYRLGNKKKRKQDREMEPGSVLFGEEEDECVARVL